MRRPVRGAVLAVTLTAFGAAPDAAADSRSATLSVAATVTTSCVGPPRSLVVTCTRGGVVQVQVTSLGDPLTSRGSFFGISGTSGPRAWAPSPVVEHGAPVPPPATDTADDGTLTLPNEAGSGAYLITVNF